MHTTPARGRISLALSAAALLIASTTAGVPALASAYHKIVPNADKVDGFHAVKSSTPVKHRKGKLVATSKKNGRLPNNIIKKAPNSAKLGGHSAGHYLSQAGAAASYELISHAVATYQTKADAARLVNPVQLVATGPAPTFPTNVAPVSQVNLSTSVPGPLEIDVNWFQNGYTCTSTSDDGVWFLSLDGSNIPSSYTEVAAATSAVYPISIHAVTPAVGRGTHTLRLQFGCVATNWSVIGYLRPRYYRVTTLQSGAPSPSVVPGSTAEHTRCTARRGSATVCR